MQSVKSKFGILISLLLCVVLISTCTIRRSINDCCPELKQESRFYQLKKEKFEQQTKYIQQIMLLQKQKDALQKNLIANENVRATYKQRIDCLKRQLIKAVILADNKCKEKMQALEQAIAKRDSAIVVYRKELVNMRDLNKEQALRIQCLTDQLKRVYTIQTYKIRYKYSIRRVILIP